MSKPAARLGDSTVHGGVITVGAPTVLIGGAPAARVSDMHVCPMLNPGTPPPPHVGGPVLMGSPTVLICGQMAARMGDMAQCSGPPDTIAMGCPTVLIGESSSAGAGAPGAGGGGSGETGVEPVETSGTTVSPAAMGAVAAAAASAASTGDDQPTGEGEDHYLDVKFVDKAGLPIHGVKYKIKDPDALEGFGSLHGEIKKTGVKAGNYSIELRAITKAAWKKKKVKSGDPAGIVVETAGIPDGTKAVIDIYETEANSSGKKVATIDSTKVQGGKVEVQWIHEYCEEDDPVVGKERSQGYHTLRYYFIASVAGNRVCSPLLDVTDDLEIVLKDENGDPIPDEDYVVYLSSGELRKGKLDNSGKALEKDVPPKRARVVFPNVQKAKKIPG